MMDTHTAVLNLVDLQPYDTAVCTHSCTHQFHQIALSMFQGAPGTQMRTIAHRWKRLDTVVPMNPNSGMSHANSKINLRITSNAVDSFALPDPETRGFHIQF